MTAKRDSKRKSRKDEQPEVKKETVKDLGTPKRGGDQVKGGSNRITDVR